MLNPVKRFSYIQKHQSNLLAAIKSKVCLMNEICRLIHGLVAWPKTILKFTQVANTCQKVIQPNKCNFFTQFR